MATFSLHNLHFFDDEDSFGQVEIIEDQSAESKFSNVVEDGDVHLDLPDGYNSKNTREDKKTNKERSEAKEDDDEDEHTEDMSEASFKNKFREVLITKLDTTDQTRSPKEDRTSKPTEDLDSIKLPMNNPVEFEEEHSSDKLLKNLAKDKYVAKTKVTDRNNLLPSMVNMHLAEEKQSPRVRTTAQQQSTVVAEHDSISTEVS